MGRFRDWRTKNPVPEDKPTPTPEEKAAAEKKIADDKAEADRKAAATKTEEQKAAEQKAIADKAEADRKAAEAAKAKTDDDKIEFEDDLAPLTTEELAKAIELAPAEADAFFKKAGIDKDRLFADARLASKTTNYMSLFPTLESAKHAHSRARAFHSLDDSFTEIKAGDMESTAKFVNEALIPMTFLRGPDGRPVLDKETQMPLTDGTAFTFLDNVVDMRAKYLAGQCAKLGGEKGIQYAAGNPMILDVLEAAAKEADKLGERGEHFRLAVNAIKDWSKGGSSSAAEGELPEAVKAELAESRKQREDINRRETEQSQKEVADFKKAALTESDTRVNSIINRFLDQTSLKDDKFLRETVFGKIRTGLLDSMSADSLYRSQRDDILQVNGLSDRGKSEWIALNVREAVARLSRIAEPFVTAAGARRLSRNAERQATVKTQEERSRMETRGGTGVSLPRPTVTDKHELAKQAKDNLRARGEDVTTESVLAEFRKLQAANSVPA
jgi:hypothetical protein